MFLSFLKLKLTSVHNNTKYLIGQCKIAIYFCVSVLFKLTCYFFDYSLSYKFSMLQILFTENIWSLKVHTLCLILCFFLLCTLQITGLESEIHRLEDLRWPYYIKWTVHVVGISKTVISFIPDSIYTIKS